MESLLRCCNYLIGPELKQHTSIFFNIYLKLTPLIRLTTECDATSTVWSPQCLLSHSSVLQSIINKQHLPVFVEELIEQLAGVLLHHCRFAPLFLPVKIFRTSSCCTKRWQNQFSILTEPFICKSISRGQKKLHTSVAFCLFSFWYNLHLSFCSKRTKIELWVVIDLI